MERHQTPIFTSIFLIGSNSYPQISGTPQENMQKTRDNTLPTSRDNPLYQHIIYEPLPSLGFIF